jgi:DNA processing protein
MNEEIYALWYNKLPLLGLRQKYRLLLDLKSCKNIYELTWLKLQEHFLRLGIRSKLSQSDYIKHQSSIQDYEQLSFELMEKKIIVLHPNHPSYPRLLKELVDCPINLFAKGNYSFPELSVGIVGSRRCSTYGKKVAHYMAAELAKVGVNIVSGLAYGIDITAHQGALASGGFTTAILGGGIHECYPSAHEAIFSKIQETGCVLSEESYGIKTEPYMFPKRNRLISGMSQGVLVVEAAEKSGSLITVDFALEQGREVFTIPNRLFESTAVGTNNLIKQGAKLVFHVDDILSEISNLCVSSKPFFCEKEKKLDEKEKIVYSCISYDPIHVEVIIESVYQSVQVSFDITESLVIPSENKSDSARMTNSDIQLCLLSLEMSGLIRKISSCYYARSEV